MSRGTGYVVTQFLLMGAILLAVLVPPDWTDGSRGIRWGVAAACVGQGIFLCVAAGRALGRGLTPYPRPAEGSTLADSGLYGIVRHPFYLGGLIFFMGWSMVAGPVALALTVVLAILWAFKARLEERHLSEVYSAYSAYTKRVRWRFLPGIY